MWNSGHSLNVHRDNLSHSDQCLCIDFVQDLEEGREKVLHLTNANNFVVTIEYLVAQQWKLFFI